MSDLESKFSKPSSKTAAAVVAGVGAVAGITALQSASAKGADAAPAAGVTQAPEGVVVSATGAEAVQGVQAAAAQSAPLVGQDIEQLVNAQLGEGESAAVQSEALAEGDVQDLLPEPELLHALASYSGVQLAQAEGGIAGMFGSAGTLGTLGTIGAVVGGGLVLNEVVSGSTF